MYWLLWKQLSHQQLFDSSICQFPDVSPSPVCNDSVNKKSKRETFSRLLRSLYWTEPQKVATVWQWNGSVIHQGGRLSLLPTVAASQHRACEGVGRQASWPQSPCTRTFPTAWCIFIDFCPKLFEQRSDLIHSRSSMSTTLACSLSAQTVSAALWLYNGGKGEKEERKKKPSVISARPF